ncbi:hypothetical protein I4U23_004952 [Adineta vaga]|nr:hypothetical protein I4U23_004952 [Adineta vaga]
MFKLTLFVTISAFIIFGMMIDKVAAGDCDGGRCGCYKGYCWAYADAARANGGD